MSPRIFVDENLLNTIYSPAWLRGVTELRTADVFSKEEIDSLRQHTLPSPHRLF